MTQRLREFIDLLYKKVNNCFSSNTFFYVIIAITTVQGLWYALSFQPSMYDEVRHIGFAKMYAESSSLNPFISSQDPKWDFIGDTTRDPEYLFYYIMSLPLRLVMTLSGNEFIQILVLRILSIALFIIALFYYRKILKLFKIKDGTNHAILLLFVLLPGISILPGVFSYDNAFILATALLIYFAVRIIDSKYVNIYMVLGLLCIGLLGTLMKSSFLVLFLVVFFYILVTLFRRGPHLIVKDIISSFYKSGVASRVAVVLLVVVSLGLFLERNVYNLAVYKSLAPNCVKIMSIDRCRANFVIDRNIKNINKRQQLGDNFRPISLPGYTIKLWAPTIIRHHASPTSYLPVVFYFCLLFFILGPLIVIMNIGYFLRDKKYQLVLILIFTYLLILLLNNYSLYLSQGVPIAMNGRYIFHFFPIIALLIFEAIRLTLSKNYMNIFVVLALMLLATQGAGLITYLNDNYSSVYWDNSSVHKVNRRLQVYARRIVLLR